MVLLDPLEAQVGLADLVDLDLKVFSESSLQCTFCRLFLPFHSSHRKDQVYVKHIHIPASR